MLNIFYNIEPKVINTELACAIGLNEAIVLQQLHYWIEKNKATGSNYRDGHYWTYGTIQGYRDRDFRFWSFNTVKRTITRLLELGFLIKGNYNKKKMDHTGWYTIDYAAINEWLNENNAEQKQLKQNTSDEQPNMSQPSSPCCPIPSAHNELIEQPKVSHSESPIWATPSAQSEPLEQLNLGYAIPENKQEINHKRLTNKTNTQKSAPTAGVCDSEIVTGEVVDACELLFDEFWKLYPRKESKQQAKKAWMKLKPDQALFDLIANALEYRRQTKEWLAEDGRYIPHPATWLNGRRWEDEMDPLRISESAVLEERYSGITVDGKPLDPVQRKQVEFIEKRLRSRANATSHD